MQTSDVIEFGMNYPIGDVVRRYADDQDLPMSAAEEHAIEAKRFLVLCALNQDKSYAMRGPVDEFWHTFVTFTPSYVDFCEKVAGQYIHHLPNTDKTRERYAFNRAVNENAGASAASGEMQRRYLEMLSDYEATFGVAPAEHLWPRPNLNEGEDASYSRCGCRCIASA